MACSPNQLPRVNRAATRSTPWMPREKRPLGDELGLTRIGINQTTLAPGKEARERFTRRDGSSY